MRRSLGPALVALVVASHASVAGLPVPDPAAEPLDLFPDGEEVEMPAEDVAAALPSASIREPFSIGEALYDPSRVPDAVVSLLDLMGVPVVADQAAADRAPRLTLSEAEARALIDMGVEDAAAAADNDEGAPPFTFADLHAFVAPFLNDVDVEALAERYAGAYERRPDDLVPTVMMGQPIAPETPLSRVHIWLLLADGFAGPGARPATAAIEERRREDRPAFAVYRSGDLPARPLPAAAPAARWGTAQGALTSLLNRALNAVDLPWVTTHLPLIQSRVPLTISPSSGVAHEGHGGPGARVSFEARIGAAAAPVVAPSGRPVLVPLPSPNLSGRPMRWNIAPDDQDKFDNHGTLQGTLSNWVPSDGKGALPLSYLPKRESANGLGSRQKEMAKLRAQMKTWDLLTSRYQLAPGFQGIQGQIKGLTNATAPVRLEWHSDGLDLELTSTFDVALDLGPLGKTHRWGYEGISGSLAKRSDGTFRGLVRGRTVTAHVGGGLGKVCPEAESHGTQWLEATATPVTRLNANQDANKFVVRTGQTDGGYVKLTFRPASKPVFTLEDACQDEEWTTQRREAGNPFAFLPFNDARWHTPEHAWVIAIPKKERLVYDDLSLADPPLGQRSGAFLPLAPQEDLGPFAAIIKGTYTKLRVEAERTGKP